MAVKSAVCQVAYEVELQCYCFGSTWCCREGIRWLFRVDCIVPHAGNEPSSSFQVTEGGCVSTRVPTEAKEP